MTPIVSNIVYHQKIMANWRLKPQESDEKIDWVVEFVTLSIVIFCLAYTEKQMILDPTEVTLSAIFPIFGSIWIACGLGIFKRLAQAEQRASPRIVTAYLFYVTLALVIITPYLKYPSLAN